MSNEKSYQPNACAIANSCIRYVEMITKKDKSGTDYDDLIYARSYVTHVYESLRKLDSPEEEIIRKEYFFKEKLWWINKYRPEDYPILLEAAAKRFAIAFYEE